MLVGITVRGGPGLYIYIDSSASQAIAMHSETNRAVDAMCEWAPIETA
jgi:hypothetical protein